MDPEGEASVNNIRGSSVRQRGSSTWASWREYGYIFQLCKVEASSRLSFIVTRTNAYKSLGAVVRKSDMKVKAVKSEALFRNIVTLDPHKCNAGRVAPQWTLIYLHSFSNKGADYLNYPHYFGISEAPVRVVIPTAPLLEQKCFKDWYVWKGSRLKWRRIKFRAWFDYLTDHAGKAENDIDLESLVATRARLHALIKREVQRQGGDSRRVLIGGASQGCCVALDAALTYPEELGGVIGVVGHLLRSTPTDTPHKSMPLHLFHEAGDGEMKWRWVKGTVERLRRAGFNVTSKREKDPSGSGHWIQEIEGKWICSALRQIVTRERKVNGTAACTAC
jgi:phospholipase/carboxylesterase